MVTLREAFERALEKKKKYIGGLLTELEEGEEQYSMAFRAQMENIERMIQQVYIHAVARACKASSKWVYSQVSEVCVVHLGFERWD